MPQVGAPSNNPNGRPVGSRNKRSEALWAELDADPNTIDPARYLSSKVSDPNAPPELRIQAATALLPYKYSKCGSIIPLRFIPEPITVPIFKSIEEAEQFLNSIAVRLGAGEIDSQSALETNTIVKTWIDSRRAGEDHQLKITVQGGGKEQVIHISGGMPDIPGTSILMPMSNGYMSGKAIEHEPPPLNDPTQSEAQGE
jgi:hypothetical protein